MYSVDTSRNLTQLQGQASAVPLDLCDGHARHTLGQTTRAELRRTAAATFRGTGQDPARDRDRFLAALSVHTGQPYDAHPSHLLYSASVAIDVVAKYLAAARPRTGVLVPVIDCVPALLHRAGVVTVPVPEHALLPVPDLDLLDACRLDALFVVAPNNPTGAGPAPDGLARLFEWAARQGVVLVLDLSFRLLDDRVRGDLLGLAETLGTDLVTIDDTGKTLPVYGTKVGVLAATRSLGAELGLLCSEILLHVSSVDLRLLATVLAGSGELDATRDLVRANRTYLRAVLSEVDPLDRFPSRFTAPADSLMGVEWVRVGDRQPAIVRACWQQGLAVLPGDPFDWAGETGRGWLRLALARDAEYFRQGADILAKCVANDEPTWES